MAKAQVLLPASVWVSDDDDDDEEELNLVETLPISAGDKLQRLRVNGGENVGGKIQPITQASPSTPPMPFEEFVNQFL